MTATEDRLTAVLAERASTVREDALRPLEIPQRERRRGPRRWPRVVAPIAAATAVVVAVLGVELVAGHMTGSPNGIGKIAQAGPTVGNGARGMAYDAADGTIYVAVTKYRSSGHGWVSGHGTGGPNLRAEPGSLAMINAAACNAAATSGCARIRYAPTGGRGAMGVAVNQRTHTAYVLNGWSNTVAVINTATCNAVTTKGCALNPARIPIPYPGTGVAVNPRTDTVYVTEVSKAKNPSLEQTALTVVNGAACDASDTRGCNAGWTTVTPATGRFLSPNVTVDQGTNTVYLAGAGLAVFNGRTCTGTDRQGCGAPVATIGVQAGGYPPEISVDPAAATIYASTGSLSTGGAVAAISRNTCNALDTTGCGRLATIRGGPGPGGSAADPGTHTLYVTNEPDAVSMINTAACNAASTGDCSQFPASFPVGGYPNQVVVTAATHTVYVLNTQAGKISLINGATCNVTDTHGCPTKPLGGALRQTPYTCDRTAALYAAGEPAGPQTTGSVRVASGRASGQAWSLWARTGVPDPYGIEQGGLVLNGRWYPLCDDGLSAGPDGELHLIDAGAHGIVYGFVQHPSKVKISLGNHRPQWKPYSVLLPGTTFYIFQLPRSACAYPRLAVNARQGNKWSGYRTDGYGTCLPNKLVGVTVGSGSWGPDYRGRSNGHW